MERYDMPTRSRSAGAEIVEVARNGCYLKVEVNPSASHTGMGEIDKWRGAVRFDIAAEPIMGRANRELIRYLEERFPEAKGGLRIVKGKTARNKRLFIPLEASIVRERLGLR